MKTALITGIRGQDAAWLTKLLLDKGYRIIGTDRRSGGSSNWRLEELGIANHPYLIYEYMDITEQNNVNSIIKKYKPNELYQLAAQSFVGSSFEMPYVTNDVNYYGHLNILEAVKNYSFNTKICFAATSEMFGKVKEIPQTETTPFYPRSPYGVSKVASFYLGINYRESYGMFISNSISFNHTGSLRGIEFISQKCVKELYKIQKSIIEDRGFLPLKIGNIYSERDFSHAKDIVNGMWLMLQQSIPNDFILSSGESISIKNFINKICNKLNLNLIWHNENKGIEEYATIDNVKIIEISNKFYRPCEVDNLIGDNSKAKQFLNWQVQYTIDTIIEEMIHAEQKRK